MMIYGLTISFFLVAMLYAAVGFGGGSGYLAVMGLAGFSPEIMRPTALSLNILVAGIGTFKFYKAGHFSPALFWPIAGMSIPFAFIGGKLSLPTTIYRPIVGLILVYAAYRMFRSSNQGYLPTLRTIKLGVALSAGAVIGLLSGLSGVGGGIFLSPLLLLSGWADTHKTMAISSAFIFVNSISGLLGQISNNITLPPSTLLWLAAVGLGGWIGAEYGSQRINPGRLRQLLALVLILGGLRMVLI